MTRANHANSLLKSFLSAFRTHGWIESTTKMLFNHHLPSPGGAFVLPFQFYLCRGGSSRFSLFGGGADAKTQDSTCFSRRLPRSAVLYRAFAVGLLVAVLHLDLGQLLLELLEATSPL